MKVISAGRDASGRGRVTVSDREEAVTTAIIAIDGSVPAVLQYHVAAWRAIQEANSGRSVAFIGDPALFEGSGVHIHLTVAKHPSTDPKSALWRAAIIKTAAAKASDPAYSMSLPDGVITPVAPKARIDKGATGKRTPDKKRARAAEFDDIESVEEDEEATK